MRGRFRPPIATLCVALALAVGCEIPNLDSTGGGDADEPPVPASAQAQEEPASAGEAGDTPSPPDVPDAGH